MSSDYRIASPFLIRLAGVPFDVLGELATPKACAAARDLLAQEKELHQLKSAALEFVSRRDSGLSSEEFAAWRTTIRQDKIPEQKIPHALQEYTRAATATGHARSQLEHQLKEELSRARRALLQTSQRILPRYLVFGSGQVHHLSFRLATAASANVSVILSSTCNVSQPRMIPLVNSVLQPGVWPGKVAPR